MEFRTFIIMLEMSLLIEVMTTFALIGRMPLSVRTHLATVSWNG
jgi:hypothetical protein